MKLTPGESCFRHASLFHGAPERHRRAPKTDGCRLEGRASGCIVTSSGRGDTSCLVYAYLWDGIEYAFAWEYPFDRTHHLRLGDHHPSDDLAIGSPVSVRVDPNRPECHRVDDGPAECLGGPGNRVVGRALPIVGPALQAAVREDVQAIGNLVQRALRISRQDVVALAFGEMHRVWSSRAPWRVPPDRFTKLKYSYTGQRRLWDLRRQMLASAIEHGPSLSRDAEEGWAALHDWMPLGGRPEWIWPAEGWVMRRVFGTDPTEEWLPFLLEQTTDELRVWGEPKSRSIHVFFRDLLPLGATPIADHEEGRRRALLAAVELLKMLRPVFRELESFDLEAIDHPLGLQEILVQCPPNVSRAIELGKLCESVGDVDRARKWYRHVLEQAADSSMWDRKRAQIEQALARLQRR